MSSYRAATVAALAGPNGWSPIRRAFDVRAFGVNAWTVGEAGERLIPEHDERQSGHEELYLVTAGAATFTVDGEAVEAPAGTLVHVPDPASRRGAVARDAGTTVLAIGATPGEAFRPLAWETNAEVLPLFASGDHAEAKRRLLEALGHYEDTGVLLYNLACAEARLGERQEALGHLAAALGERPDLARNARDDEDLASLQGDARFEELVAA